jgi:hypothetical protein
VLLTFEALVVALVADVVLATYPSRHVDHKKVKNRDSRHHCNACRTEFKGKLSSFVNQKSINAHTRLKRGNALVLLVLVVATTAKVVVT